MPHLDRDGTALYFEEAGDKAPPILFVHGWCCDHTYFTPQFEHFRRGHRVVAVDLRGHGQSDKPVQPYTMECLADDLAWLCSQLRLVQPVVIGHSMGGLIALCLAARHSELPAAIVTLDAPIAQPPTFREALALDIDRLGSPDYRAFARQIVSGMFLPTDDPKCKARIIENMSAAPQHVMLSFLEQSLLFDSAAAAAACRVPVLNVWSAGGFPDLARFRELCPQLIHGQTVGSGHFHQLEVPDQINAMIERFLAISQLPTAA